MFNFSCQKVRLIDWVYPFNIFSGTKNGLNLLVPKCILQLDRRPFEEKISSGHIWDSCMKLEFCNLSEEVKTNFFPGIHHLSNKSDLYTVSYTFVLETECKSFSELRENAKKTWQSRVEFHRGNLSSTGWLGPSEGADGAGQGILGQGILDCQTSKPRLWRRDISGQWLSESSSDKETALRSKILDGPFADPWSQIWLENICLGHKRWPTENLSVWRRSSKVGWTHFLFFKLNWWLFLIGFLLNPTQQIQNI